MPCICLGKAEQLLQMLGKTMMSAAVWKISPRYGHPVTVISAVECERAKYHPVVIYAKRMRSSANINPHSISCLLTSQRVNVPVTLPDGNHDGFINWHHLREKTREEKRTEEKSFSALRHAYTVEGHEPQHQNRPRQEHNYQHIKNTGGAVVAMVKQRCRLTSLPDKIV